MKFTAILLLLLLSCADAFPRQLYRGAMQLPRFPPCLTVMGARRFTQLKKQSPVCMEGVDTELMNTGGILFGIAAPLFNDITSMVLTV
jgi:hypothetical protein